MVNKTLDYNYCVGCACLSTYPQKEILCLVGNIKRKIELVKPEECFWEKLKKEHPNNFLKIDIDEKK